MTLLSTAFATVKNWWSFLIKGLLLLGTGVFVLARPAEGYLGLSILFSIVILSGGITQVFFALSNRKSTQQWSWTEVSGIIEIAIGIFLLSFPLFTTVALPFIIGFWLLFNSFYLIGASFKLKHLGLSDWGWLFAGSLLMALASIAVLYFPGFGVIGIIAVSATALLIGGGLNILLSFKLRSVKNALKF